MSGPRFTFAVLLLACASLVAAPSALVAQDTGTVTGTVVDEEGTSLPGANVTIVGTQQGTSTNADGQYTLENLEPQSYTLRASFVGYRPQEQEITVTAGETVEVDFVLPADVAQLDEMVVVGYGEQEREDLTGSISSVEGESISKVTTSSVSQALQGKVAGVQFLIELCFLNGRVGLEKYNVNSLIEEN